MKEIRGFIKYHSSVIFPVLVFIICNLIDLKFDNISISENKATALFSVTATFVGVLITILTIYLAVPKTKQIKAQLIISKHERIYLTNLLMGIIMFMVAIFVWLFGNSSMFLTIFFCCGTTNLCIALYYTFSLIKLI